MPITGSIQMYPKYFAVSKATIASTDVSASAMTCR